MGIKFVCRSLNFADATTPREIAELAERCKTLVRAKDGSVWASAEVITALRQAATLLAKQAEDARDGAKFREIAKLWPEAFAAFKGAFDTPAAWQKQDDEYAQDARSRIRAIDAAMQEKTHV